MMAVICSQNIDKARIIALYDNAISDEEAAQLYSHVESCSTCSAYLDDIEDNMYLLSNHRLPAPMERRSRQDRLWLDLRHQIVQRKKRNLILSLAHNNRIRSFGAIAATMALVVLFVQVFHVFGPQQQSLLSSSSLHFTSSVAFAPFYISPDGESMLGVDSAFGAVQPTSAIYRYRLPDEDSWGSNTAGSTDFAGAAPTDPGSYTDFATPDIATLYTTPRNQSLLGEPVSDGHYLAWMLGSQQGGDSIDVAIPASLSLQVMNLQNGQTQIIAIKSSQHGFAPSEYGFQLAHGDLFWQDMTTGALKMRDLATGAARTLTASLALSPDATGPPDVFQVSWPFVMYAHVDGHEHLLNVMTGKDAAMPDPPTPSDNPHDNGVYYQIVGTTVIASWLLKIADHRDSIRFGNYDLARSTPSWQEVTTIDSYDFSSSVFIASDRLLLLRGKTLSGGQRVTLLYDRQLRKIIDISTHLYPNIGNVANAYLLGKWLVLTTGVSQRGGMSGTLIDTTHFVPPSR